VVSSAQTFTTLVVLDPANGTSRDSLVQGIDGNLYGTTISGGASNSGTVFEVTPTGVLTAIYSFCAQVNCADGIGPQASLTQATNGNLYGTTYDGGTNKNSSICSTGCGTVFRISPKGSETALHEFCAQPNCSDGAQPAARLIQGADGNFYGTTQSGGSSPNFSLCGGTGCGTFFKITPAGTFKTLYNFCSQPNCADGWAYVVDVMQASDGNFYGTTSGGGVHNWGTVFRITPSGELKTLYNFCSQANCADGASPNPGLIQATDGNFYGTTVLGGTNSSCNSGIGCGTVFKMSSTGIRKTLYSFCAQSSCADGFSPPVGLIQAVDGKFYGSTGAGGSNSGGICSSGCGTLFQLSAKGVLTTLYNYCSQPNCEDGTDANVLSGGGTLVQATNGIIYGITYIGGDTSGTCGTEGCGTVFSLALGLHPFVEALPTAAKVGAHIIILGTNLRGTTGVSFNGTKTTFTVVSGTEIKTTVPTGATTGKIEVITSHGNLLSNVVFRVIP